MKRKLLIIDDNEQIRMLLKFILENQFDIEEKENGYEALMMLQQGYNPDLIVSDLQMPEIDGFELIESLKATNYYKNIPILVLSGKESSEDRIKSLKLGANEFLVKPFNPEELKLRISKIIDLKAA